MLPAGWLKGRCPEKRARGKREAKCLSAEALRLITNEVKQRLFMEVNILLWTKHLSTQQFPLTLKPPPSAMCSEMITSDLFCYFHLQPSKLSPTSKLFSSFSKCQPALLPSSHCIDQPVHTRTQGLRITTMSLRVARGLGSAGGSSGLS